MVLRLPVATVIPVTGAPAGSNPGKGTSLVGGCGLEPYIDVSLLEGASTVSVYRPVSVIHLIPAYGRALYLRRSIQTHASTQLITVVAG